MDSLFNENYTAEYFPSGEQKFERLKEELEKAQEVYFMEYFIVEHGVMWDTILEILERKAKEGVEVRLCMTACAPSPFCHTTIRRFWRPKASLPRLCAH